MSSNLILLCIWVAAKLNPLPAKSKMADCVIYTFFYSVSGKKMRPTCFSGHSDEIWYTVSWINSLQKCERFQSHLHNVSTLLVKLQMLDSCMWHHWLVRKRNSRIYYTLTVAYKFDRFESSWLQCVGNIARECVQNTHHWSGRTETAPENRMGQDGSCRHCDSHASVASSIGQISDAFSVHLLL